MSMTLADWFQQANCPVPQAWMHEVRLKRKPFHHQVEGLNRMAQAVRFGLWLDTGLGKTYLAQAHALWLIGYGNKSVMVCPPTLLPQFAESLRANFPGIEEHTTFGLYYGSIKERQAMLDEWEATRWPDLIAMSYQAFQGIGPSLPYRKAMTAKTPEEALAIKQKLIGSLTWQKDKALAQRFVEATLWHAVGEAITTSKVKQHEKRALFELQPPEYITTMTFDCRTLLDRGYTDCKVDEANCVAQPSSQISKAVKLFAGSLDDSNGLCLMTGTPVLNTPLDTYGLFALLAPDRYGSKRAFERLHVEYGMNQSGYSQPVQFHNHDYLWAGLHKIGYRKIKSEVMDMPPKIVTEIPVDLSDSHRALYKQLMTERVLELEDGSVIDATQASRFYNLAQQLLITPEDFGYKSKENTVVEALLTTLASYKGQKVVVYAWFRRTIEKLTQALADRHPAVIYGEVTGASREGEKQRFLNDPRCEVIILQIRSGGVGLDGLQAVSSTAIFAEIPTVPGLFQQATDRLYRTGQTGTVNIYLMVVRGTIALRLRNNLVKKDREANEVIRDKRTLLGELMGEGGIQGELR